MGNNNSVNKPFNDRPKDLNSIVAPREKQVLHINIGNSNKVDMFKKSINQLMAKTDTDGLWKPNDELYRVYNAYVGQTAKIEQFKTELKTLEQKRIVLLNDIDKYTDREIDGTDQLKLSYLKRDLVDINIGVDSYSKKIAQFGQVSTDIINLWDIYYSNIGQLILDNDLGDFTSVNQLICSQNIYAHISGIYRELMNTNVKEEIQYKLDKLTRAIDINYVMNSIDGQNKEYIEEVKKIDIDLFGIQNGVMPVQGLLTEIYKEVHKIPVTTPTTLIDDNYTNGNRDVNKLL